VALKSGTKSIEDMGENTLDALGLKDKDKDKDRDKDDDDDDNDDNDSKNSNDVASFSGLSIFDCPSVFSNVYLGNIK
jgi:hypothetical protein